MALTKAKLIADGVIDVDNLAAGHSITTSNIGEGSNLYYTDARVASYLTTNSYATEGYVTTAVANLVDSAPSTLDTLNELAAALGDDPNFATTVTNSIATKLPLSGGTVSGNLTVTGSLTGTLATAAQPNVTSVGTLSSLAVSGNLTVDTNTLYVDAANNRVGIGTSSPSTFGKFAVSGTGSIINATSSSGTAAIGLWESSVSRFFLATLGGSDGLAFIDGNGSSERMRIDASGNVGIGTSSPASMLNVVGTNTSQQGLFVTTTGTGNDFYAIKVGTGTSANTFSVTNAGRVGIGTSSPSFKLDVTGASNVDSTARFSKTSEGSLLLGGNRSTSNCPFIGSENAFDFAIITNNTEKMRVLAGGGLTFNGDTAAANALDDYEEGTWTTGLYFEGGSATYANSTCSYTKIGNAVFVSGRIALSSVSNPSGNLRLSLPFAPAGGGSKYSNISIITLFYNAPDNLLTQVFTVENDINPWILQSVDNGAWSVGQANVLTGNEEFQISGFYFTA